MRLRRPAGVRADAAAGEGLVSVAFIAGVFLLGYFAGFMTLYGWCICKAAQE